MLLLEVEIVDYSGDKTVRETKILTLSETIALKAEVDQLDNKVAHIAIPKVHVSGYLFNLGERVNVLVESQQVGEEQSYQPVVIAYAEELEAALVYSVHGTFDPQDEEMRWEIEHSNFLSINLPEGDAPSAGRNRGFFRLISRTPITDSEIEAAKAEVERLWSCAVDKTLGAKEIFAKLSSEEQEFLRRNLRPGIAPEEED